MSHQQLKLEECERAGVCLDARQLNSQGTEGFYWACQARGNDHAIGSVEDFADLIEPASCAARFPPFRAFG